MTQATRAKHLNLKIAIYLFIFAVMAYIGISVALSIGIKVFWDEGRKRVIPEAGFVQLDSPEQALKSAKGVMLFYKELVFNVKRFTTRFRFQPKHSLKMWNAWQKDWREDFRLFGKRYGFSKTTPKEKIPNGAYCSQLIQAYRDIAELEVRFTGEFNKLYQLHTADRPELKARIDEIQESIQTLIDKNNE